MKIRKKQSEEDALTKNSEVNLNKDLSVPHEGRNSLKLDELNDEHIKTYAENWRLISLIEKGLSIKEAKKNLE